MERTVPNSNAAELAVVNERLDRVEDGVANFRKFQTEVRDFISRTDMREEIREEERKLAEERREKRSAQVHAAVVTAVTSVTVGSLGWLATSASHYIQAHWTK